MHTQHRNQCAYNELNFFVNDRWGWHVGFVTKQHSPAAIGSTARISAYCLRQYGLFFARYYHTRAHFTKDAVQFRGYPEIPEQTNAQERE